MRTLKDVLAVIQRITKLDKRFLYARQLFLPDGELRMAIALAAAASNDTPVIVGCGEPFNRTACLSTWSWCTWPATAAAPPRV